MHFSHLRVLHFKANKELKEIYLSIALRFLALSMVGIFVPVYLFTELGYSLSNVTIFFIIYSMFFGMFTPPSAKIISKIGLKHSTLLSIPFTILFIWLLHLLKTNPFLFYFAPMLLGIGTSMFWMSHHLEFVRFSDRNHRCEEVGFLKSLVFVAGIIGPFLGGLILTLSNFNFLYLAGSIILICSTIPLFFSKDYRKKYTFSFKQIFPKRHLKEGLSFIALGIRDISAEIFWPLFIFLILKQYFNFGLVFSVATALSAFTVIVIGRISDVSNKKNIIKIGSVLEACVWMVKSAARTVMQVFSVTLLGAVTISILDVPFGASVYNKSKGAVEYFIFREMTICFGRVLVLLLVLLTGNLISSFMATSASSLLFLLF